MLKFKFKKFKKFFVIIIICININRWKLKVVVGMKFVLVF